MATSSDQHRFFETPASMPMGPLLAALVPLSLLWVHSLPLATRRGLALAFGDPTLPTAFTAHFVHLSTGHLVSNLILYSLVVPTAYLLARRTDDLRTFRRGFLFCVLLLATFSVPESVSAGLGLYVHFLGYALAFIVVYVADATGLLA